MLLLGLGLGDRALAQTPQPPVVTGVTASQRAGTTGSGSLVDIGYTISDANFTSVNVFVLVSSDSGNTWTVPALTFTGDYGLNISVSTTPTAKSIHWSAGADWGFRYTTHCRVRVLANTVGLVVIPPGTFQMGDLDGEDDAPVHTVTISNPYWMDANLVSGALWTPLKGYAEGLGYTFVNAGSYKALTHPIQTVDWYHSHPTGFEKKLEHFA